jgi:hypothetical protein
LVELIEHAPLGSVATSNARWFMKPTALVRAAWAGLPGEGLMPGTPSRFPPSNLPEGFGRSTGNPGKGRGHGSTDGT